VLASMEDSEWGYKTSQAPLTQMATERGFKSRSVTRTNEHLAKFAETPLEGRPLIFAAWKSGVHQGVPV
jgi:hypothetical protein